jgi:DNA-3-methyladenine glycosylase II
MPSTAAAADAQLRAADPVLAALIDRQGPLPEPPARGDHYGALVRAIVGQQLSTKAARAIHERLLERFGGRAPAPEELLGMDAEELRAAAGLSRAKVVFLRSLAEHVVAGDLDLDRVATLSDDEVVAELTAVKGVGVWTAHMFLIFQLGRPDVLPVGDLGIRRAVERAYGLRDLPSASELEAMAEPWRPHRTAACLHLWRSLDATPGA